MHTLRSGRWVGIFFSREANHVYVCVYKAALCGGGRNGIGDAVQKPPHTHRGDEWTMGTSTEIDKSNQKKKRNDICPSSRKHQWPVVNKKSHNTNNDHEHYANDDAVSNGERKMEIVRFRFVEAWKLFALIPKMCFLFTLKFLQGQKIAHTHIHDENYDEDDA